MQLNLHTNLKPQSMFPLNKSSLLYEVWCIFIEFHHYAHIIIQVGNLNQ